jgi:uncharacterized protein YkwD
MRRYLFVFLSLSCATGLRAQNVPDTLRWKGEEQSMYSSMAGYMSIRERMMLTEINRMRSNPALYAEFASVYLTQLEAGLQAPPTDLTLIVKKEMAPGFYVDDTLRGRRIFEDDIRSTRELIAQLQSIPPLPPLVPDPCLYRAARAHGSFLQSAGDLSHIGTGGSDIWQRINSEACFSFSSCAENLVAYRESIRQTVLDLLIDAYVPTRIHRKIMLDPGFNKAVCAEAGRVGRYPSAWVMNLVH